jgi:hypothetical protein
MPPQTGVRGEGDAGVLGGGYGTPTSGQDLAITVWSAFRLYVMPVRASAYIGRSDVLDPFDELREFATTRP